MLIALVLLPLAFDASLIVRLASVGYAVFPELELGIGLVAKGCQ